MIPPPVSADLAHTVSYVGRNWRGMFVGGNCPKREGRELCPSKKNVKADIALHGNPVSELRDLTCHMGSHSVTCHPTQVNVPRLTPATQAGT